VFSAIVLLIGIVIFGEIAEAMEVTLPSQGTVLPPLQALSLGNLTANDEWQLSEQQIDGTTIIDCKFGFGGGGGLTNFPNPPAPAKTSRGYCEVFKVFDKADIIEKTLSVKWSGNNGGDPSTQSDEALCVLDGIFDRNNRTQFPPLNVAVNTCAGNTGVRLHFIEHDANFNANTVPDTITMTLAGSTQDQITIMLLVRDSSSSARHSMNIQEISVLELANWDWKLGAGATVTMATTTTNNDTGITNAPLTNLLPLILSESDQQQVDTFNNAQVIGFTVIGILPVALFFALFSIFSGRIE